MSPSRLLRAVRTSAGLSQAEVAQELGVSIKTVQRWERGATPRGAHVGALVDLIERLELPAPPQIVVPRSMRATLRSAYDECLEMTLVVARDSEPKVPGWSWVARGTTGLFRRAAIDDGPVFVEEVIGLANEHFMAAEWRLARFGKDPYKDFRSRRTGELLRLLEARYT